jgi:uncharacterized protein YndB with AHSA1/START domain
MSAATNPNEAVFIRTFDAPRQMVWDAWTKEEHLMHWMGPAGAKGIYAKMDLRAGGSYHYAIEFGGQEMWGKWAIKEIDPPKKLVVVQSFSDKDGGITAHPMAPTWPKKMFSTTTFEEANGKTTIQIHWEPYEATQEEIDTFEAARPGMGEGWAGTFVRLDEYLDKIRK